MAYVQRSPIYQTKPVKGKEKGIIESAWEGAKKVVSKVGTSLKNFDKSLEGNSDTRSFEQSDTVLGYRSSGARTGQKTK